MMCGFLDWSFIKSQSSTSDTERPPHHFHRQAVTLTSAMRLELHLVGPVTLAQAER
jgi:hypothetical protein